MFHSYNLIFRAAPLLLAGLLSACAGIPADRGFGGVQDLLVERQADPLPAPDTLDSSRIEGLVLETLAEPLTPVTAVQVALLRNPRLRSGYAQLGIAQAELYQAARAANPTLSLTWLDSNESGAASQVTVGLAQDFLNLLMIGPRKRIAERELERSQRALAADILALCREVEAAWFGYVAALQVVEMRELVARAADVSARLARRFHDAGNINELELHLELAAASSAQIEAQEAEAEAQVARAELNRIMGLTDDQARWQVKAALPLPVSEEDELADLQRLAQQRRLELKAARLAIEQRQELLDLTRGYRYVGAVEAGVEYERETDRSRLFGPTLTLELPLFNRGASRVLAAEAELELSRVRLRELEISISNGVALSYRRVRAARKRLMTYREQLLPQREAIVEQSQLMQNYMLIGQFELLRAKQQQFDSYQGYIEALADYWQARTALAAEIGGPLPSARRIGAATMDIETLTDSQPEQPPHGRHGHSGHPGHHNGDKP